MIFIKRVLGWFGFKWCPTCGRERDIVLGAKYYEYWDCPHCDHLDRFDIRPVTKEAKKHMEKVHAEKGRPPSVAKKG